MVREPGVVLGVDDRQKDIAAQPVAFGVEQDGIGELLARYLAPNRLNDLLLGVDDVEEVVAGGPFDFGVQGTVCWLAGCARPRSSRRRFRATMPGFD